MSLDALHFWLIMPVRDCSDGACLSTSTTALRHRLKPNATKNFPGFKSPSCVPTTGSTPDSLPGQTYNFSSPAETFTGARRWASVSWMD